jgi:phospholipase/lecithinase/hemolysin
MPLLDPPAMSHIDHLYAFGDSTSDNGNFFSATQQPPAPYAGGRFSNGPIWVEYLAHDLGLKTNRLADLAYSGAGSGFNNVYITDPNSPLHATGLLAQVQQFTAANPSVDPNALYTIWVGINDYARNPADPRDVVANIATAVSELAAAGARNILVVNQPDLGALPGTRNFGPKAAQLSALANTHDADLAAALGTLNNQYAGAHFMILDVHILYNQMMTNPGTYGFTDVTDSALGNTVYPHEPPSTTSDVWKTNPSALMFWDSIHLTTVAQQVVAEYALSVVDHDLGLPNVLTVSNLNDSGVGSLRYELAQAQDGATIVFARHLHGTITLTSGELQVGAGVTIQGPGKDALAISGNHATRVFEILAGADATVSDLTVSDGVANPAGAGAPLAFGGGILVDPGATLALTNANVVGNVANAAAGIAGPFPFVVGNGGGIYNSGTLTLTDDLIRGNTANTGSALVGPAHVIGNGGGIYNAGTLTMTGGAVEDNTANTGASSAAAAGEGGGIYSSGTLQLADVSVSGNTANAGPATGALIASAFGTGGGLFVDGGTATVVDSVFADDTANAASANVAKAQLSSTVNGTGGGIYNDAQLSVTDTLFFGDVANSGSASGSIASHALGSGGGIFGTGQITVDTSIFFENTANAGSARVIEANGGAIGDQSALVLTDSLVVDNTANTASGAIELLANGGGISTAGGTITDSVVAFNVVNSGSVVFLASLFGGGIDDTGGLTVAGSSILFNSVNTNPGVSTGTTAGGGIEVDGGAAQLTLNSSSVAGNFALNTPSDIGVRDSGQVDPASANNLIGTGGSGGLVSGVNGNVVL